MIIPRYWAEARMQHRDRKRQVTVRRFGWSDIGEAEAQAHAESRVREAFERILAGESLPRYERRVAYNGAEGVPIREEIVDRHGAAVITRNTYGALCLNTPDALFADIDFEDAPRLSLILFSVVGLAAIVAFALIWGLHWRPLPSMLAAVFAGLMAGFAVARKLHGLLSAMRGGPERHALQRVRAFVAGHPDWRIRVYRTPQGLRLLAMHRRFAPRDPEVEACFLDLGVDPVYILMCRNQNCFRARVSPKPWRIGMSRLHAPYSAAWRPEHAELPARQRWIENYAQRARDYASCRFVETLGSGTIDPDVEVVQRLHDALCNAESALPIA